MKRHSHARRSLGAVGLALLLTAFAAPGDAPVADAAMARNRDAVLALIKQGADVNMPQGDGATALHWAAVNGDVEMTKLLIYAGAHLGAVTRNGAYTPLHLASQMGRANTVEALLAAGADPNAKSSTGVTPLHFAAGAGDVATVKALLSRGADKNAQETASEQTPLVFAAAGNRVGAVEALLAAGADPNIASKAVDVLARKKEDNALLEARNKRMLAVWGQLPEGGYNSGGAGNDFGSYQFAELMNHSGALAPLHHAARMGSIEATVALLKGGARIDQVSADHSTPLLTAIINGYWDLAMVLIAQGADPKIASEAGATPLYGAINLQWHPQSWTAAQPTAQEQQKTSHLELMEALLKAGADPNARLTRPLWYMELAGGNESGVSQLGATPFWRAAYGTDVPAMKLLVKYGADPNLTSFKPAGRPGMARGPAKPDASGLPPVAPGGPAESPIHVASGAGYGTSGAGNVHRHVPEGWMAGIRYLVEELGADVNARDADGYTPLHNAAGRGDTQMVLYLVSQGADVMAVSRSGQTTADMANGPSIEVPPYPETRQLLESLGAKNNHKCVQC